MKIRNGVILDEEGRTGSARAFGAKGDGTGNDTAAIQAAVNAYQIINFPPGVYCVNGLRIPTGKILRSNGDAVLMLDFPGTTPTQQQAITIAGSHVYVDNLTFRANNTRWAAFIDLDDGDLSDIYFDHCQFLDLNRGVRVRSPNAGGRTLRNLYITDCVFKNLEDKAVDLLVSTLPIGVPYSLDNVHIERNRFEDIAPNSSGKGGEPGNFDGAIYIGGLNSVKTFYLCDNTVYRAGPQFLAMSATSNPREDFVVRGNTVKQAGTEIFINMGYTFNGVNNLSFSDNTTDFSDFELLFLNDCKNYRVSNCHFSRANVGIAIHERTAVANSYGVIANCTFEDIETPSAENNGNKAILIIGDVAQLDIVNCRFRKRNGTKNQIGIDSNYFSTQPTQTARLPIQVSNCTFDNLTGIVMRSGGSAAYPGAAKVQNCNFRKCPTAISFTHPFAGNVAFCTFDQCDSDVRSRVETVALRAVYNTHTNTNPLGVASNGAYVVEHSNGTSLYEISSCMFRNVKGVHVPAAGSLLPGTRQLIWNNNGVDGLSTGVPVLGGAVVKGL